MGLSSQHLFLFVHPLPWLGRLLAFRGREIWPYTRCRFVNYWQADQAFRSIAKNEQVSEIPCVSIWWAKAPNLSEQDFFQLRSYMERYRLVQMRKSEKSRFFRFQSGLDLFKREELEISGRESGWCFHHDPGSLADFHGLSLLREDFLNIAIEERGLHRPRIWVEAALKRRFDLQFVPRQERLRDPFFPEL